MKAKFSAPTNNDNTDIALKLLAMQKLIKEEYGYELCQSLDDLSYLQKVIDDKLIDSQDWYSLECLGVVFGRVMVNNNSGLDWWAVEDKYGRDVVIRYKETTLQISIKQILGKRLHKGDSVNVKSFYDSLLSDFEDIKLKVE